ncbi:hypothetical protein INR49_032072 [Caranx melampygus]|nr:hypothetical protein INR49_032072 [Caranx melampygus]
MQYKYLLEPLSPLIAPPLRPSTSLSSLASLCISPPSLPPSSLPCIHPPIHPSIHPSLALPPHAVLPFFSCLLSPLSASPSKTEAPHQRLWIHIISHPRALPFLTIVSINAVPKQPCTQN